MGLLNQGARAVSDAAYSELSIDPTEKRSGVPELLIEEHKLNCLYKGHFDYTWTPPTDITYIVERKAWDDFFASLSEIEEVNNVKVAKLVRQLWLGRSKGFDVTLLLEGLPWVNPDGTVRDRKWKRSSVDAMLLRFSLMGVRIMVAKSYVQSALWIATLFKATHDVSKLWPTPPLDVAPVPMLPIVWEGGGRM